MTYERPGESPLDYNLCRYGHSKLLFRGPKKSTSQKFFAFIGGTETYGKYIERPFPDLIERSAETTCVNFGAVNASVDAFVNDDTVLTLASKAKVTVVQITGAHNMTNRFYSVHPRRNDRFLKASTLMQTIFRDIDFTDFSFTRHLLSTLKAHSPEKFAVVEQELKSAWKARMELMLNRISGRVILLWVSARLPDDPCPDNELGIDPLFVDKEMVDFARSFANDYVEVIVTQDIADQGTNGMLFPQMEAAAASEMFGPTLHDLISEQLLNTF